MFKTIFLLISVDIQRLIKNTRKSKKTSLKYHNLVSESIVLNYITQNSYSTPTYPENFIERSKLNNIFFYITKNSQNSH